MKLKRRWLLLLPVLALFAWAYRAAAWRPKLIGGQPTTKFQSTNQYSQLLISPDGLRMASYTSGFERSLVVWALDSRRMLWQHSSASAQWVKPLAFSPDSRLLAVISYSKTLSTGAGINLVDVETGKAQGRTIPTANLDSQSAAFLSPRELVVASHQGVSIVDTQTQKIRHQWSFDLSTPTRTRLPMLNQSHVAADGKTVIVLVKGKTKASIVIYDAQSGRRRRTWITKGPYRKPLLSPDGTLCVLQRQNRDTAEVYECATGQLLWGPFVSRSINPSWNWSEDSQQISSFYDPSLNIFDARTGRGVRKSFIPADTQSLALDSRGGFYYTLDNIGKIWRWRLRVKEVSRSNNIKEASFL